MTAPQQSVKNVLDRLKNQLDVTSAPASVTIQEPDLTPHTCIALAAVLLEYPIAYAPTPTTKPNNISLLLGHIPLDLYRCEVARDGAENDQTLFQFSCPQGLEGLSSEHLFRSLQAKFTPRCDILGITIKFHHTNVTLDNVTL